MKRLILCFAPAAALIALSACVPGNSDKASERQAEATRTSMDSADREVGMPRIANYSQRKLLKNAYEDMDQTTLTYVYTQALDGRFVCLGQGVGYGVSLGTQFTAPEYPQYIQMPGSVSNVTEMIAQPDPNGLYQPSSGDATIVNLVDPVTGHAHTAVLEPKIVTLPFKLPAASVAIDCPTDVDPTKVKDAKEASTVTQRD